MPEKENITGSNRKPRNGHVLRNTLAIIVSSIVIATAFWTLARPWIVSSVSAAMADDLHTMVQDEVGPLKQGFQVIIAQNVLNLRKQIAQLERVRAANPQEWTAEQANELVELQSQLAAQERAMRALRN